jgi:hypothetical protein
MTGWLLNEWLLDEDGHLVQDQVRMCVKNLPTSPPEVRDSDPDYVWIVTDYTVLGLPLHEDYYWKVYTRTARSPKSDAK